MNQKLLNDTRVVTRFWQNVVKTDTCWNWVGHKNTMTGYGLFALARGDIQDAYLVSYEMANGPIPEPEGRESIQIEQTCKNPKCVRPDHVQIHYGSERERFRAAKRAAAGGIHPNSNAARKERTECLRGHPYTEENTKYDKKGHRRCRQCKRDGDRKRRNMTA